MIPNPSTSAICAEFVFAMPNHPPPRIEFQGCSLVSQLYYDLKPTTVSFR